MPSLKSLYEFIKKMFVYTTFDAENYWRKRAKNNGYQAVMWNNKIYNSCASKNGKRKNKSIFQKFGR